MTRYAEKAEGDETKILLYFEDLDGRVHRISSTKANRQVYSMACGFGTANRNGQELWISNYRLKPGTVEIDEDSNFAITILDPGFVPGVVNTKEKQRKDWQ